MLTISLKSISQNQFETQTVVIRLEDGILLNLLVCEIIKVVTHQKEQTDRLREHWHGTW